MSKPSQKKTTRHNRKYKQKKAATKNWKNTRYNPSITPDFPAERDGVPAAGASWIGQKMASFLRIRSR